MTKPSTESHKNMYGYFIDPIHDEHKGLGNISEVSDACIVTSIIAALGVCSLVSLVI